MSLMMSRFGTDLNLGRFAPSNCGLKGAASEPLRSPPWVNARHWVIYPRPEGQESACLDTSLVSSVSFNVNAFASFASVLHQATAEVAPLPLADPVLGLGSGPGPEQPCFPSTGRSLCPKCHSSDRRSSLLVIIGE